MHARLASIALTALIAACDHDEPTACDAPMDEACAGGPPFTTDEERAAAEAETDRLAEIQDRHVDDIFAESGVLSMGIGYDCDAATFVFVVGYDQDGSCPAGLPLDVEGVPLRVFPTEPAVAL